VHEYYSIKQEAVKVLSTAGYSEESEDVQPDHFGSILTTFVNGDKKARLVWDGRDGWGFAQVLTNNNWIDVEAFVPESNESEFMKNTQILCSALGKALAHD
jgi:hypothetical protein